MDKYNKTLEFLYTQIPMFQRIGGEAYKPGLGTSIKLCKFYENPQNFYKTIHVGGTNGKGSTSHLLAATLQDAGYKVGLYTSPHLVDLRERIKVNGTMIPIKNVIDFVDKYKNANLDIKPSFFELTMAMAFNYFKDERVDVAIIEVGLGGRLDSTNIITPDLSVITNISFDHTQFLGNTLTSIASEKAGIIKHNIPVIIGETTPETKIVFSEKAEEVQTSITFAEENNEIITYKYNNGSLVLDTKNYGELNCALSGIYQIKNGNTVLNAINSLRKLGYNITKDNVSNAFSNVCKTTGLMGRWMKFGEKPLRICDTGHNIGGFTDIVKQLKQIDYRNLRIVIGFVNDKDVTHIMQLLPKDATYYFTNASVKRALKAEQLIQTAAKYDLQGKCYNNVETAYLQALNDADYNDMIYVGGSTFIVADLISFLNK